MTPVGELAAPGGLRGPRPPALVCLHCDATIAKRFDNPVLEHLKRTGAYAGETTGGVASCDECIRAHDKRLAAFVDKKRREVIDVLPREAESRLSNFEKREGTKSALAAAADWLEHRDRDFFLYGKPGTGKTRLAISLANEVVARGLVAGDVIYVRVPTLIKRLKAGFGDNRAGELARLGIYERAALLILDDLAAEQPTAYTRTTIESLYNDRIDAGRLTIITSNLPLGLSLLEQQKPIAEREYPMSLVEFMGDDRMTSRMAGNTEIVEIGGSDYRLAGWKTLRRR